MHLLRRASARPPRRPLNFLFTTLFVFFFFAGAAAMPTLAQTPSTPVPVQWSAAADALAGKIAATAGEPRSIPMNMTNTSSLSVADSSSVYDALLAGLRARKFQIASPVPVNSMSPHVQVTFSEDLASYVWVAQIWNGQGSDPAVVMVNAPKMAERSQGVEISLTLSRRRIWSQPGQILDFILIGDANHPTGFVLLEPARFAFYRFDGTRETLERAIPILHVGAWPRDLSGAIDAASGKATLGGAPCSGDVLHPDSLRCDQTRSVQPWLQPENKESFAAVGDADGVALGAVCAGIGPILLVSGNGDWMQPDQLQAYAAAAQKSQPLGQPLQLPGPILSLGRSADGNSARVVTRNLQTGMYEASIVSAACGD